MNITAQDGFLKTIGGAGDDVANSALLTNDANYLVAGSTTSYGSGSEDGFIVKVDPSGAEIWSKAIGGNSNDVFQTVIQLSNNDFITAGWSRSYGSGNEDIFVSRIDNDGNLLWSRTFGGVQNERGYSLAETSDGNIILAGWTESYGAGLWDIIVLKLDLSGIMIWSKTYGDNGNDWANGFSIIENTDGDYVVVGAWSKDAGIPAHNGILLKLDSQGNIIFSKIYGGNDNDGFNAYINENNGVYHNFGTTWSFNGPNHEVWMTELDLDGNVNWSKTYGLPNKNIRVSSAFHTDNDQYLLSAFEFNSSSNGRAIILKVDAFGNLLWSQAYGGDGMDEIRSIFESENAVVAFGFTESFGAGGRDILMIKTDDQGHIPDCSAVLDLTTTNVNPITNTPNPSTFSQSIGQDASPISTNVNFSETLACPTFPIADFEFSNLLICEGDCIDLTNNSYNFDVFSWSFTGSSSLNSTMLNPTNVCFVDEGINAITLIVSNDIGADTLIQTITVSPFPTVELGNDSLICNSQVLELDASFPNATYQWSDNSVAPLLEVLEDGIYSVTVSIGDCSISDTIQIEFIDISSNLGNDTTICLGDVLILDVSDPLITNYVWQDGSVNSSFVVNASGTYYVDMTSNCGTTRDSVEVDIVNPVENFDLGSDTTFCYGNILFLEVTQPNAVTYLWNDGSTNSSFIATESGKYNVIVSNGCNSEMDAIDLMVLDPILPFDLGRDTILCEGLSLGLDAFQPLATEYIWQDGSTTPTLNANNTGIYFVEVINECGSQIDTINLMIDKPIGIIDLGNDTVLCLGNSVLLDATHLLATAYSWQDESQSPVLSISTDGLYEVNVSNGCNEVKDQINIAFENCCELYIPNIFSPNNDGANEEFKVFFSPETCGSVALFLLEIFDRWGNLVFSTNNLNEGWDGSFRGKEAKSGVYTWTINFSNEEESFLKVGDVTILR